VDAPEPSPPAARARRAPPPFLPLEVRRTEPRGPHLVRVTLGGPGLADFPPPGPAASVRVLLPPPRAGRLVLPAWTGNEFLLPDGRRPIIRTLTPRHVDHRSLELDVEVVVHGEGAASSWARDASTGDPVAVSGPGRGYGIDAAAPAFLLGGDETALAALAQLLEALPPATPVAVHIEVATPDGRVLLPEHPGARLQWWVRSRHEPPGAALVAAVRGAPLHPGTRVWVAGEASAVQQLRRYLFEERGLPRAHAAVRGYWKHGRQGGSDDA
jgi:NADPH-dependent ferric siderophore reductase